MWCLTIPGYFLAPLFAIVAELLYRYRRTKIGQRLIYVALAAVVTPFLYYHYLVFFP